MSNESYYVAPVSEELYEKMLKGEVLVREYEQALADFENRAYYVLHRIMALTNRDFNNADLMTMRDYFEEYPTGTVGFEVYNRGYDLAVYSNSFPAAYLWRDDFEADVVLQLERAREEKENEKQKAASEKERRLELCMQVYNKLTDEERAVVTFPSEVHAKLKEYAKLRKHEENMRQRELHKDRPAHKHSH